MFLQDSIQYTSQTRTWVGLVVPSRAVAIDGDIIGNILQQNPLKSHCRSLKQSNTKHFEFLNKTLLNYCSTMVNLSR